MYSINGFNVWAGNEVSTAPIWYSFQSTGGVINSTWNGIGWSNAGSNCVYSNAVSLTTSCNQDFVVMNFPSPTIVTSITWTGAYNNLNYIPRGGGLNIQTSNDGVNFVTVYSPPTVSTISSSQQETFYLPITVGYLFYRLMVTNNVNNGGAIQIGQIMLQGAVCGSSCAPLTQFGYIIGVCSFGAVVGQLCTATCNNTAGYYGTPTGGVSCTSGLTYSGVFSGCSQSK